LSDTQSVSSSQPEDVGSLLTKPLQRLLQYPPLLTDIFNETPDLHPDKENLRIASATIEQVARKISYARQRVDVVKEVLASKSMKKAHTSIGLIAPVRISKLLSIRHSGVRAAITRTPKPIEQVDEEAACVETLQAELKGIESFALKFAKNVVDFGKVTSNITLAMRTWSHSFGAVLDISAGKGSEAFDGFLEIVEGGLLPLASDLERAINKRVLKDLSYLLMTMNQPLKLIASMNEHQPRHFQLLTLPINAKNKSPNLLAASNKYMALRDQLAAELPTYIRLLHKGLATLVLRLAEIQTAFWSGVGDRWVELYDLLGVESEQIDGKEICAEWHARWAPADERLSSLTVVRPVQELESKFLKQTDGRAEDYQVTVAQRKGMVIQAKEKKDTGFTFQDRTAKIERFKPILSEPSPFKTSHRSHPSTHLGKPILASRVSIMTLIEEEGEDDDCTCY
jgi:hypothetical protein